MPHRQAPQPPVDSKFPPPELHADAGLTSADAGLTSADADRVSAGSSAGSGLNGDFPSLPTFTVQGENEEDPEPPSYPPPPPPPEEEEELENG